MASFSCILPWSQIKDWYVVVYKIVNENWGTIVSEVRRFHCRIILAAIISSIKVYNWMTTFEYYNLPEIEFF